MFILIGECLVNMKNFLTLRCEKHVPRSLDEDQTPTYYVTGLTPTLEYVDICTTKDELVFKKAIESLNKPLSSCW